MQCTILNVSLKHVAGLLLHSFPSMMSITSSLELNHAPWVSVTFKLGIMICFIPKEPGCGAKAFYQLSNHNWFGTEEPQSPCGSHIKPGVLILRHANGEEQYASHLKAHSGALTTAYYDMLTGTV